MAELFTLFDTLPYYSQLFIHFGAALLLSAVFVFIVYPLLRATAQRADSFALEAFSRRTRSSVYWMVAFGLTLSFWAGLVPAPETEAAAAFPSYVSGFQIFARTLLYVTAAIFILRVVGVGADTVRHKYRVDETTNVRERKILTQLAYIRKIIAIAVFIVFAALILMQFEAMRSLGTTLLTTAGVSGIVIGLAAQKSIANLLAGFQIAFTQPIRIDDALMVNGEFGTVEEITLTYVTMKLWDQRRQIVPLQKFIDDTFQNWTRSNPELIGTVLLFVDYTMPVKELRAEVERFVPTQTELWDGRVANCLVTDNNERTMTCRVLVSAANAGNAFQLRCATREHLIGWIQEHHPGSLPKTRVTGEQKSTNDTGRPATLHPSDLVGGTV